MATTSLVSGALLSAFFNVFLERLTPELPDLIDSIFGKKLDKKLSQRWKSCLNAANAVLLDAEFKRFTDHHIKVWYDDLFDAVYELDDLIDSFSTPLNLCDTETADKLEGAIDRIESLVSQKDVLGLTRRCKTETVSWRPPVIWAKVPYVCGREREKEDIIKLLFADDGDDELSIIPIVGTGGVGKTTLAQLVYHEDDVDQKFDCKAWVCVSENFDLPKILQTIMNQINDQLVYDKVKDLDILQVRLEKSLARKKFFIVLDDVWRIEYGDWDNLKVLLDNKVKGCKILVTTRDNKVASMVQTSPSSNRLHLMSDEGCFSIFSRHAFHCKGSSMDSCLEKIGRDVARKCKGLPLAAKVLGGLFRSKPDVELWNSILKDNIWKLYGDAEFIPALRVSYYYLPPHLKRCFVYCSLFPKDHPFVKEQLMLMWMAEGLLQPKGNKRLEEVGYEYFDELISISFFEPSPENDGCFVMHDLIHELATRMAGKFYTRLEKDGVKISNMTRHLSCNFLNYPCLDTESFQKARALRTFVGLELPYVPCSIGNAPHILSFKLKSLRTLSLSGLSSLVEVPHSIGEFTKLHYLDLSYTNIKNLPDSISKLYNLQALKLNRCQCFEMLPSNIEALANLRHLDVSATKIASLPDSLCKIFNLQTLKVRYCNDLKTLPCDMQYLVNLQHLDTRDTPLKHMPRGLRKLKDLQLGEFVVGNEQEEMIGELGEISNTKDEFKISKLESVRNGNEASKARMMEKKGIKYLQLSWSGDGNNTSSSTEKDILENLQPHLDLTALEIEGYRGAEFPDWLGHHSYHNMTSLNLLDCKSCPRLAPLGQLPALKSLCIQNLGKVERIHNEFLKGNDPASMTVPFASLEFLEFRNMNSWVEWHLDDMEAFPKLKKLEMVDCPILAGNLPSQLLSLETLLIIRCPLLGSCIPRCPKLKTSTISESKKVVWQEPEFPPFLHKLAISGYQMLESMSQALSQNSQIQDLSIHDCSDVSLPTIHLPQSLKRLFIERCEKINFVLGSTTPLQNLQLISIDEQCKFLKFSSASGDMEGRLPNLRKLRINRCSDMEAFPEGIFVSSLTELHILLSWKLASCHAQWQLPMITYLRIRVDFDMKCFPEACSLPASLITLELEEFEALETLNCKALQHLTSLQELKIMHCPHLKKMSGAKLPSSIRKLYVWDCPLLEKGLQEKDEELMPMVGDIDITYFLSLNPDPLHQ